MPSATTPRLVTLKPFVLDYRRVTLTLKTVGLAPKPAIPACMVNFAAPAAVNTNALPIPNAPLNLELDATIPQTPTSPNSSKVSAGKSKTGDASFENRPYPNVELSLLDAENNEVAQAIIVEHQEEEISFTLHLRRPQPGHRYTARADMIQHQELIQRLNAPFTLVYNDG